MFSKTSIQIIRALVKLAKLPTNTYEGAGCIAQKIRAPKNYLGKLLQNLSTKGLVISQKGFGGGFRLGKDPKKITLYDVVGSVENVSHWSGCAFGFKKCSSSSPCPAHDRWKIARATHLKFLKKTTIGNLVR